MDGCDQGDTCGMVSRSFFVVLILWSLLAIERKDKHGSSIRQAIAESQHAAADSQLRAQLQLVTR